MTAKEYLESKGIFSLDTKKRTEEVNEWMEKYASHKAEEASVEFAQWLTFNGWIGNKVNCDRFYNYEKGWLTTSELYQTFKNQKP